MFISQQRPTIFVHTCMSPTILKCLWISFGCRSTSANQLIIQIAFRNFWVQFSLQVQCSDSISSDFVWASIIWNVWFLHAEKSSFPFEHQSLFGNFNRHKQKFYVDHVPMRRKHKMWKVFIGSRRKPCLAKNMICLLFFIIWWDFRRSIFFLQLFYRIV